MNLAAVFRPFFRPPDTRPEKQIESELDEEFAFHVEQIQRELLEAEPSMSTEEASCQARARFGDVETLKKRCKRIAMEERVMLQRTNAVLMIIVILVVVGVSAQVYLTQRYNTLALQDISSQIANMRINAATEARDRGWASGSNVRTVMLQFAIAEEVRDVLLQSFGPRAEEPARQNVVINADARTNSLLVVAEPPVWEEVLEAVKDLDLNAAGERTQVLAAQNLAQQEFAQSRDQEAQVLAAQNRALQEAAQQGAGGTQGLFYISGHLGRTGAFELPTTGAELTLRRAVAAAIGGLDDTLKPDARLLLLRADGSRVFDGTWQELRDGDVDPVIEPMDLVEVSLPD